MQPGFQLSFAPICAFALDISRSSRSRPSHPLLSVDVLHPVLLERELQECQYQSCPTAWPSSSPPRPSCVVHPGCPIDRPTDCSSASTCCADTPSQRSHATHAQLLRSCANPPPPRRGRIASPSSSVRNVMVGPTPAHQVVPSPPSLPNFPPRTTCILRRQHQARSRLRVRPRRRLKPTRRPNPSQPCFYRATRSYRPIARTPLAEASRSWATRGAKTGRKMDGECASRAVALGSMREMSGI